MGSIGKKGKIVAAVLAPLLVTPATAATIETDGPLHSSAAARIAASGERIKELQDVRSGLSQIREDILGRRVIGRAGIAPSRDKVRVQQAIVDGMICYNIENINDQCAGIDPAALSEPVAEICRDSLRGRLGKCPPPSPR